MAFAVSEVGESLLHPRNGNGAKTASGRRVAVWTGWSEGPDHGGSPFGSGTQVWSISGAQGVMEASSLTVTDQLAALQS